MGYVNQVPHPADRGPDSVLDPRGARSSAGSRPPRIAIRATPRTSVNTGDYWFVVTSSGRRGLVGESGRAAFSTAQTTLPPSEVRKTPTARESPATTKSPRPHTSSGEYR